MNGWLFFLGMDDWECSTWQLTAYLHNAYSWASFNTENAICEFVGFYTVGGDR